MNKGNLMRYILENFTVDMGLTRSLIDNILDWVSIQSMDREDTINALLCLLDGLGITRDEIEQFVEGGEQYE